MTRRTLKTIDELCGKPAGSFKKFLQEQRDEARRIEMERRKRILEKRRNNPEAKQ